MQTSEENSSQTSLENKKGELAIPRLDIVDIIKTFKEMINYSLMSSNTVSLLKPTTIEFSITITSKASGPRRE
jgi:hypothetical protein